MFHKSIERERDIGASLFFGIMMQLTLQQTERGAQTETRKIINVNGALHPKNNEARFYTKVHQKSFRIWCAVK